MKNQNARVQKLLSRLRDLESESLQIAKVDLPAERCEAKTAFQERLEELEKAHSHSWFGDHATTYFGGFQIPPGGRSFDVEWGFVPGFGGSHNPGWRVYSREEIKDFVFRDIGEEILSELAGLTEDTKRRYSIAHNQVLDVMEALSTLVTTKAMTRYTERIERELTPYSGVDFLNSRLKSVPRMTRDSEEIAKGQAVPSHVQWEAVLKELDVNRARAQELGTVLRNIIEATTLFEPDDTVSTIPRKIFIGHGRAEHWRSLKDFIRDRLHLDYEEFNRISSVGISTQERLSEMLAQCGFAFLVLTAEDLHSDGSLHARENVIHEAGLFQGRLGWRRAIIILEDGCEEFSNIVGVGQIRFKGKIDTCFEDVRRVLEREQLITG